MSTPPTTRRTAPTFTVTLRALPRSDDQDGSRRLRAALKTLLRSYGLRCVRLTFGEAKKESSINRDSPPVNAVASSQEVP